MYIQIDLTSLARKIENGLNIFSRDSDLRTRFKDVDILKKMWICINISTSFFNISTSYVTKTNISTSFFNISTSTGMWIFYVKCGYTTSHCGTFKHVGGHKLLKACPFFVSWQIKKSKLPKDYLHRKGSLGGCGQFFPPHPPPQNCPLSTKINFWHCSDWKKIVHKWNLMHNKILVNLTYFPGL